MKCSICATCYNEVDDIENTIRGVCEITKDEGWEVVVVDASSNDGTLEVLWDLQDEFDLLNIIVEEGANIGEGRRIASKYASGKIHAQMSDVDADWPFDGRIVDFLHFYEENWTGYVLKGRGMWVCSEDVLSEIGGWNPFPVAEERDLERRAIRHGRMKFCNIRLRGDDSYGKNLLDRAKRNYKNAVVKFVTGVSFWWYFYLWMKKDTGIMGKISALTIAPLARISSIKVKSKNKTYDRYDEFIFRIGDTALEKYPEMWIEQPKSWEYDKWKDIDSL